MLDIAEDDVGGSGNGSGSGSGVFSYGFASLMPGLKAKASKSKLLKKSLLRSGADSLPAPISTERKVDEDLVFMR